MKVEADAVKAALEGASLRVYDTTVPTVPALPYVLLWGTNGTPSIESLVGPADVSDRLGATVVAGTADGVRQVTATVRAVLDAGEWTTGGRHIETHLWDSQAIQVDDDVILPGTNAHPCYGVDIYALTSVPV